jgi:hypothetical protein
MTRRSFLLHIDSLDVLDELSNEEAGKLLKAMRDYHNDEEMQLESLTKIVFSSFKNQFNRDTLKYQTTCERRANAGSMGGKQKVANASKPKQKVANLAENDNVSKSDSKSDSKNDSDNVNDSDNKNKSVSVIKDLSPKVNANLFLIDEIFQYWVLAMNKGSRTSLTTLRKSKISSRLKDGYPSHEIKQAIDNVAKDSFLVSGGHTDIEMICRSDTNLEKYRDAMPVSKSDIKMSKHNQDIEEFSRGTQ